MRENFENKNTDVNINIWMNWFMRIMDVEYYYGGGEAGENFVHFCLNPPLLDHRAIKLLGERNGFNVYSI